MSPTTLRPVRRRSSRPTTPAPASPGPMRRAGALGVSTLLLLGTVGLALAGGTLPAPGGSLAPLRVAEPVSDAVVVCASEPGNTVGAVDLATPTTQTRLVGQGASATWKGAPSQAATQAVDATDAASGGVLVVTPEGDTEPQAAGWTTSLTRSGDLRSLSATPCQTPTSSAWLVGGSSAVGHSAELRLANPGTTPVTASVQAWGSTGPLDLGGDSQLTVPAGGTATLLLESRAGADDRLAAHVEASGGLLAAWLLDEALDGETAAGSDLISPSATPSTVQLVPGVALAEPASQGETASDSGATSSDTPLLRLVNPGSTTAVVDVTLDGADGPTPLAGATGLSLAPGTVLDLTLTGVSAGDYAVRVVSDQPVAAAVQLVRSAGEHPERSGKLLRDRAWSGAVDATTAQSGLALVPHGEDLAASLLVSNTTEAPLSLSLEADGGQWSKTLTLAAGTTQRVEAPAQGDVVSLSADGPGVVVATMLSSTGQGEQGGSLFSLLPSVADAQALGSQAVAPR